MTDLSAKNTHVSEGAVTRSFGLDLLKVIGIFLIVLSHVIQTLGSESGRYGFVLGEASADIQHLILIILSYSGVIGNTIFFMCSAWFWIESEKFSGKKWLFILADVWIISVLIFAVTNIIHPENATPEMAIKCLMPTTFANNWYITCYLLFYPIHPLLNKLIKGMTKKQLFRTSAALTIPYLCLNFIFTEDLFFVSPLITWLTIYFAMAYVKLYLRDVLSDKTTSLRILGVGTIGHIGIILITDLLGLICTDLSDKVLRWRNNCNPFIIISVFALTNLLYRLEAKNSLISGISKLSLLIYLIHENIILRTYYRVYAYDLIHEYLGYDLILIWVILLAVLVFAGSAVISFVYDMTLRKYVKGLSERAFNKLVCAWSRLEERIMMRH